MTNTCSMKDCQSSGQMRSFHAFPQDPERCKAWVEACGRPELLERGIMNLNRCAQVCDLHFKQSDLIKKRLNPDAVPYPYNKAPSETVFIEPDVTLNYASDSNADVDNIPGTSVGTNSTKSPARKVRTSHMKKLQEKLRFLEEHKLSEGLEWFKLIDAQLELEKRSKDKRCTEKLRLLALKLYLCCPTTYKVNGCAFSLPSEKILRRTNLEISAVMSGHVINYLKFKIESFKDTDRYCTIGFKKIPLKRFLFYHINTDKIIGFRNINGKESMEPATEVCVLMARGLKSKWEQPLTYCFLGKNDDNSFIYPWLESVLTRIMGIGYNVVAVVVDHEDLYDLFRRKIHSLAQPYIAINVNCDPKKVYCIFNLPQLIISLRNTFITHKLQFKDEDGSTLIADWGTIEQLCSGSGANDSRFLVPKLTKAHIHPNESEKKKLKYAVEVFSKSVSEALEAESKRCFENDFKIRGTQKLTELVNDIFDILNSSTYNHHNKCKNAFTGEPYQMRAVRRFMEFLTNVKPLDDTVDTSFSCCIYGLRISIMSFSIILRDLLPKGIKSLVTHRFNLDIVDRFFEFVKGKSMCEKPSAVQFYKYFRQKFMTELLRRPKTIGPADNLLSFTNKIDLKSLSFARLKSDGFTKTIEVGTVDYRFEMPTRDAFYYICWYLLKKCYEVHDHSACKRLTRILHEQVLDVDWKYYTWDTYFHPPNKFVDYVKILDEEFNACFGNKFEVGLGTGILLVLKELKFLTICPCFPVNYLRRLFVRMRIFNIIRYNNRHLCDESFTFSSTDHYNIDIM